MVMLAITCKLVQRHILLKLMPDTSTSNSRKILVGAYGVFCVADVGVLCCVVESSISETISFHLALVLLWRRRIYSRFRTLEYIVKGVADPEPAVIHYVNALDPLRLTHIAPIRSAASSSVILPSFRWGEGEADIIVGVGAVCLYPCKLAVSSEPILCIGIGLPLFVSLSDRSR